jgi:hypothetical protein
VLSPVPVESKQPAAEERLLEAPAVPLVSGVDILAGAAADGPFLPHFPCASIRTCIVTLGDDGSPSAPSAAGNRRRRWPPDGGLGRRRDLTSPGQAARFDLFETAEAQVVGVVRAQAPEVGGGAGISTWNQPGNATQSISQQNGLFYPFYLLQYYIQTFKLGGDT